MLEVKLSITYPKFSSTLYILLHACLSPDPADNSDSLICKQDGQLSLKKIKVNLRFQVFTAKFK